MHAALPTGRELAERGAMLAAGHADAKVSPAPKLWSDAAFEYLEHFINLGLPFMVEDVRAHAESHGLLPPPDGRAWGAIVMRATRSNRIERIGYAPMKSRNCHANPKSVWRKKSTTATTTTATN